MQVSDNSEKETSPVKDSSQSSELTPFSGDHSFRCIPQCLLSMQRPCVSLGVPVNST